MFRRRNSVASAGKVSCLIPFTMMFNQRVQEIVVVYTYTRRGLLSLNFITIGFGAPIHFVTIDDNSVCIGIHTNILLRYCHTRNKDNTTLGLTSCTAYVDGIITSRIRLWYTCFRSFTWNRSFFSLWVRGGGSRDPPTFVTGTSIASTYAPIFFIIGQCRNPGHDFPYKIYKTHSFSKYF